MKRINIIFLSLLISLFLYFTSTTAAQYDPDVYQAQKALKARGYNPGTSDGLWGKSTESAIKHFQVDNELPVTGKLDEQTKAKLDIISTTRSVNRTQKNQERRIALVIGNSAYKSSPLINPVNDAKDMDMASTLRQLGFDVSHKANADRRTMEDAIFEFSNGLKKGGINR